MPTRDRTEAGIAFSALVTGTWPRVSALSAHSARDGSIPFMARYPWRSPIVLLETRPRRVGRILSLSNG